MISGLFSTFIYNPLYNGLIFLLSVIPGGDIGVAVILLTLVVKFILFPLARKAVVTNMKMKELQADMKEIQKKHKDNKEEQAMATMNLYREKGINPFSSLLLIFIQIPIILGLYWVFLKAGWPAINTEILYSFIQAPESISTMFLGFLDVTERSVVLAVIAGATQYFQVKFAMPPLAPKDKNAAPSFKDDLARSMQVQLKYVLPIIVMFIAYSLSSAISLYWITSNLFTIWQEVIVRRQLKKEAETPVVIPAA